MIGVRWEHHILYETRTSLLKLKRTVPPHVIWRYTLIANNFYSGLCSTCYCTTFIHFRQSLPPQRSLAVNGLGIKCLTFELFLYLVHKNKCFRVNITVIDLCWAYIRCQWSRWISRVPIAAARGQCASWPAWRNTSQLYSGTNANTLDCSAMKIKTESC
jgi:hypothetical protein